MAEFDTSNRILLLTTVLLQAHSTGKFYAFTDSRVRLRSSLDASAPWAEQIPYSGKLATGSRSASESH